MKFVTLLLLLTSTVAMAKYQYVSPMPGSTLNSTLSHIIIREGSLLDPASIQNNVFDLQGSKSGQHSFRVAFSDDQKTILLYPQVPFGFEEEVTVSILQGLVSKNGNTLQPFTFKFTTDREYTTAEKENFNQQKATFWSEELKKNKPFYENEPVNPNAERELLASFTIVKNTNATPGAIFYDAWNGSFTNTTYDGYNIISPDGDSIYASDKAAVCFDFSVNPNGYLSVYNDVLDRFDVLDSNYQVIDSYYPGNGRTADPHEFTIYEDGHAFMVAEETHVVDMTVYNPTYSHNATVMTTVIQEFDQSKNVIFEWRAWDHVVPTESYQNLALGYIDAVHTNSIDLDDDGNIVASNRHLNQVNKIDRNTGEFIWRLGGVENEFTFVNEPEPFTYEHDARRLSNGNITLWDNGNQHVPAHSMAKEYQLDEINKTATLVWSFQPKSYSNTNSFFYAMGSVRRLANGNTLVNGGWDASSNQSNMWEVTSSGEVVWELALNNSKSLVSYRAAKYTWQPCALVAPEKIKVKEITDHSAKVTWKAVSDAVSYDVQYRKTGKPNWKVQNTTHLKKLLSNLDPDKIYEYQVRANCMNGFSSDWSLVKTFTTLPLRLAAAQEIVTTFSVYPNPTSNLLNMTINSGSDQSATISVFDLSGKTVFTASQQLQTGEQVLTYDLTQLPAGIYLSEIKTVEGSQTMKFVKE